MTAPLAAALLALAAASAPQTAQPALESGAPETQTHLLVFRGNVAILDEVYETLLDLPAQSVATRALADDIETRLQAFLRRAGYELARVHAQVLKDQIVVDLDEGRIDRVVFFGGSLVGTELLRLQLLLPFNVFNRPLLSRQLLAMRDQYGMRSLRWELVAVAPHSDALPFELLEKLRKDAVALAQRSELLSEQTGFELRIFVEQNESSGFSPVVGIGNGNGIEAGAAWHAPGLIVAGDHLQAEARLAANTLQRLDDGTRDIFFSHLALTSLWLSPPLGGSPRLRGYVEAGVDVIRRQREDLLLNSFRFSTVSAGVNLRATLPLGILLHGGLGFERRWLTNLEPANPQTPLLPQVDATARAQTRWTLALGAEVALQPAELRHSRQHHLVANLRLFAPPGSQPVQAAVDAEFQRVLFFGYNELWLQARGWLLLGDVPFYDERQVSDVTRGPFGSLYVRDVGGPRAELRIALLRDVLQFGLYDDVAVYGSIDRITGNASLQAAEVGGVAVHALLLDSLQLDLYLGLGITTQGKLDQGFSLQLQQAF